MRKFVFAAAIAALAGCALQPDDRVFGTPGITITYRAGLPKAQLEKCGEALCLR